MDEQEKFWREVYLAVVGRVGPDLAKQTADEALEQYKQKFQRVMVPGGRN